MTHSVVVLLVFTIFCALKIDGSLFPKAPDCGILPEVDRIIGGQDVKIDDYPWLALIEYKGGARSLVRNFQCGGSLINTRYVLTSAHCYTARHEAISVRLGEYRISTEEDCVKVGNGGAECVEDPVQDIPIERFFLHEKYVPNVKRKDYRGGQNDIALIRLVRKAELNFFVSPICLPLADLPKKPELVPGMSMLHVAGWGLTENGTASDVKQTLQVPVVGHKECQRSFTTRIISASQICAGGERGKDACRGDSGGPLMQLIPGPPVGFMQLIGVVSYGPPCTSAKDNPRPSVYASVGKYMDWIVKNVHE